MRVARAAVLSVCLALLIGDAGRAIERVEQAGPWRISEGRAVLDVAEFGAWLATSADGGEARTMWLPRPDGSAARFHAREASMLAPGLARDFPEIRTFVLQGIDDPTASGRLGWTAAGLHAIVLSGGDTVSIDPDGESSLQGYHVRTRGAGQVDADHGVTHDAVVEVVEAGEALRPRTQALTIGTQLTTFRLALAATGEYTALAPAAGGHAAGSKGAALTRMVTTINRVNAIFERDLNVRLTLLTGTPGDSTVLIHTNAGTDPYSNGDGREMISENGNHVRTVIGDANYDVGHVFGTAPVTGFPANSAAVGVICNFVSPQIRARGASGSNAPIGDEFDLERVAHNLGHQFGAQHTFNGTSGDCETPIFNDGSARGRNVSTAFEPGSGQTIMGYPGRCSVENTGNFGTDRFHPESIAQITTTVGSWAGACGTASATGNTPPVVSAGADVTIPARTPFALTATATDTDGDSLTYAWDQVDLGAATSSVAGIATDAGTGPLFRSFGTSESPTRFFPSLTYVQNFASVVPNTFMCLGGATCVTAETMPTTSRTMQFTVTARDNRSGGGGVATDSVTVTTVDTGSAFRITSPNTAVDVTAGDPLVVTWDVAGTTAAPISAANVSIWFSTDGGETFTRILAESTPNDGTHTVVVPDVQTTDGRIRVQAAGNIFFDINDSAVAITSTTPATVPATPAPPTGESGDEMITLNWTAPSDGGAPITGYAVQQATHASGPFTSAGCSFSLAPTCNVVGLTNGVMYFFKVAASNSVGQSEFSAASNGIVAGATTVIARPSSMRFSATRSGPTGTLTNVTPTQTVAVTFGAGSSAWSATADQPWVALSAAASGTGGAGVFTVSINNAGNILSGSATSLSSTITLVSSGRSNSPLSIPVVLTIDESNTMSTMPIGQVDSPAQGLANAQGAIGMTGWALDNVGVASVQVFRNCLPAIDDPASCQTLLGNSLVYIGDAAFLAGARTDVEGAFTTYPQANRAGWGLLVLTSMLPDIPRGVGYGGEGTIELHAIVTDVEGNRRRLGRSSVPESPDYATPTTITMANSGIAKPFGVIDTPTLGSTVSGIMHNFGWALTPDTNTTGGEGGDVIIPLNGSTMTVFIDAFPVALVNYNQCRGSVGNPPPGGVFCNDDVSNIFGNPTPQGVLTPRLSNPTLFRNLDAGRAPIGSYSLDTTTLTNGLHTIAWSVTDSLGRTEGIGSRFFNVLNGAGDAVPAPSADAVLRAQPALVRGPEWLLGGLPPGADGVWVRRGFDLTQSWSALPVDAAGGRVVEIDTAGRVELWLGAAASRGFLVANGTLRDLPPGSTLRGSQFAWTPPVGYVGDYLLAFVRGGERVEVTVRIR